MNLEKRKKEIETRLTEIRGLVEKEVSVEKLDELDKECTTLQEERSMIEKKMSIASKVEVKPLVIEQKNEFNKEVLETRGKSLKENRVIQVSSDEILLPQHVAGSITPYQFEQVSELVDRVKVVNINGGETYKKSFIKGNGIAGTTLEGKPYAETEPSFGYLTITKVKITAYTEITEELEKLPSLPYQAEVLNNINTALRQKISEQIVNGLGTSNTFTGIFSEQAVALADTEPLEISTITDTTLDDIVYSYGGKVRIQGGAVLILNMQDLHAFGTLRGQDGKKVYDVKHNENTINGIPYIVNPHCKALSNPATADGEYCMAYGSLNNYEVPIFSPVEIGKSTDYKFKDGIICYKASVFTGGNVVGYNGFLRIKKKISA